MSIPLQQPEKAAGRGRVGTIEVPNVNDAGVSRVEQMVFLVVAVLQLLQQRKMWVDELISGLTKLRWLVLQA